MEKLTAEQILKKHIPNGCINIGSYKEEQKLIVAAMQEFANQELGILNKENDPSNNLGFLPEYGQRYGRTGGAVKVIGGVKSGEQITIETLLPCPIFVDRDHK